MRSSVVLQRQLFLQPQPNDTCKRKNVSAHIIVCNHCILHSPSAISEELHAESVASIPGNSFDPGFLVVFPGAFVPLSAADVAHVRGFQEQGRRTPSLRRVRRRRRSHGKLVQSGFATPSYLQGSVDSGSDLFAGYFDIRAGIRWSVFVITVLGVNGSTCKRDYSKNFARY